MLARHDLVWLHPDGWRRLRCSLPDAQRQAIDRWCSADWPVTVRRQDADVGPDEACLGITMPRNDAAGTRTRVSLCCRQADIQRAARPISLDAADVAILPQWVPAWQAWQRSVREAGLEVRVFGSLALEVLTGQPYLTDRSDIDLLFFPNSLEQLRVGITLFATCVEQLPLDGEIVFPSGRAVAWKEWRQGVSQHGRSRVLVKQIDRVSLCSIAELLAEFKDTACVS